MGKADALMPTSVLLSQSAADLLCCLGLGLALAAIYDAVVVFAGKTRGVVWILDLVVFAFAGVLVCSYAAARSYAGVVRWYHLGGMLLGQWAYYHAFCAVTQRVHGVLTACVTAPFRWLFGRVVYGLGRRIHCIWHSRREKRKKKRENKSKQLQTSAKMLYNSR